MTYSQNTAKAGGFKRKMQKTKELKGQLKIGDFCGN